MTNTPFNKTADDSTGFLLWQVTSIWQRQVAAALRTHDLTQVQFALLASILWLSQSESDLTQIRIARHAKLDVMMTSQVLRSLEKRGLIERQEHPSDTRAKVVHLTEAGVLRARQAIPAVEQADEQFFNAVGEQRKSLNLLLNQIITTHQGK